jgi:hypothetical protein
MQKYKTTKIYTVNKKILIKYQSQQCQDDKGNKKAVLEKIYHKPQKRA